MKIVQILWTLLVGAGLLACSSASVFVQTDKVEINTATLPDDSLQAFIAPFKKELAANMDRVIGYATEDLLRDRPESTLGNFVIDETENYLEENNWLEGNHYISIMNHGGLRSPISKGNITVGDIYKLMPFDNTVVLVKLPGKEIVSIFNYLKKSGGEPTGGFQIDGDMVSLMNDEPFGDTLYVITTDYLANGGDNMSFFKQSYESTDTGIFLREALIKRVEAMDTLRPVLDNRIKW
ncbi:5'-nucleotidase C-terminal domain-containing protein [Brumimicrobium mesophilum]|uniref:5'-nucleotidase C-terminal domain-containing protein n=1 Tax=Brumimicrobium mesophilum TaxID=392717 RepID=UPI000D142EC9|nr:5'-nucleotidase C-terminal domain-containing protein [Brumimicrobium mesophilum]